MAQTHANHGINTRAEKGRKRLPTQRLTPIEHTLVDALRPWVRGRENILKTTEGHAMSVPDIARLWQMDEKDARTRLRRLIRKNILGCFGDRHDGLWIFNPAVEAAPDVYWSLFPWFGEDWPRRGANGERRIRRHRMCFVIPPYRTKEG